MMDCRLIAGHWISIALSILLFNIGIALASFATTFGSQGWRIVGVTILGIGFLMLITIPLLIRRNIRSRLHEAFRSLTEAEMRRKRCSGHYIAWVLSAINFVLGIALTSYATDIQSDGWSIVGLILIVIGLFLMIMTSIFIYVNLRERKPKLILTQYEEQQNNLISKDTTKVAVVEANGVKASPTAPSLDECPANPDEQRSDNTGPTIMDIKRDQIEQLSSMMDHVVPNWNIFGHRIASYNVHQIRNYNELLHRIDECRKCNFAEDHTADRLFTYLQIKEPKICVRSFLEYAEMQERGDLVDFINTANIINAQNGDDKYLCDVDITHKEIIVRLLGNYVEEDWSSIAESFDITYSDISDILQPTPSSPTCALFDLLKLELPNLTIKEISSALKDIGRNDVANYLEKVFLSS